MSTDTIIGGGSGDDGSSSRADRLSVAAEKATPSSSTGNELTVNFIVYPPSQARPALGRFALFVPADATGADIKEILKRDAGYSSRWLQVVHLGRVVPDHEKIASFGVQPPRDTLIVIPKPARLLAKQASRVGLSERWYLLVA